MSGLVSTLADSYITQEETCQPDVLIYLSLNFPNTNHCLSAFLAATFTTFFITQY